MVVLRVPPLPCLENLGDDLLAFGREMLCLDFPGDALGDAQLFRGVGEDGGAILCGTCGLDLCSFRIKKKVLTSASISPLAVHSRRIMGAIKKLWQRCYQHF